MNYNPTKPRRDEIVCTHRSLDRDAIDDQPLSVVIAVLTEYAKLYGDHALFSFDLSDGLDITITERRFRTDEEYAEAIVEWERACERAAIHRLPYAERERIRLQNLIDAAQAALAKLNCN